MLLENDRRGFKTERGKIYQKYAGIHYLKYDAFITVSSSRGTIKLPAKGRVIIDASGYSRYNLNTPGGYQVTAWNPYPIIPPLTMPFYSPPQQSRVPHEEYRNEVPLPDEIICLTPPTHKAWSFVAKTWGSVLVANLSEIVFDDLAFDQLVLKPDHKKMIKAMVETYSEDGNKLAKDLVSGKGGGLVMVLHGKPGALCVLLHLQFDYSPDPLILPAINDRHSDPYCRSGLRAFEGKLPAPSLD
ncbi:hypothetical protein BN14_09743 [Rhizoctonia solani AG-1 IB]|uniref:Uncharacterized protein n=1 Tax=Thanatephorus cucumeris (strain AG1-IB / isolate 7/3/14) TaxID=1108050 RepID=M5C9D1_THACB|nr:hypothetical protein BN14_09743 [Rhizoctonia solani AG-1 IB]